MTASRPDTFANTDALAFSTTLAKIIRIDRVGQCGASRPFLQTVAFDRYATSGSNRWLTVLRLVRLNLLPVHDMATAEPVPGVFGVRSDANRST